MTPELHAHIKHALSELAAERIDNTAFGICWHVCAVLSGQTLTAAAAWLLDTAEEWPEFSGSRLYPVPSAIDSPEDAYRTRNVWIGEYGAAHQRLVAFLLEKLEQEPPSDSTPDSLPRA